MSSSPSDAFFEGRGIPVELSEVEQALDRLWGPAAEKAGGPELDHPAVTRVAMANVVLVRLGPDRPDMPETISAITTLYPSRLIVLRPGGPGGRAVAAEVSAQCHLPAPGRPQVCSEQIILRAGPEGLDLLPGAVRSLLESDLHSVLWWCDDPRDAPSLFEQLAAEATRVILDLPDPGADPAALRAADAADRRRLARDLAWFGLTTWRGLIADLFDAPATADLRRIASVRVRAIADAADRPPRAAAWLVAWLAGQLGWRPDGDPRAGRPGRIEATFRGPSDAIAVAIEVDRSAPGVPTQVAEVEIALRPDGRPATTLGIRCDGTGICEVRESGADGSASPLPRLVKAPIPDAAQRVSAALLSDRSDPPYHRALPIALWLLGA